MIIVGLASVFLPLSNYIVLSSFGHELGRRGGVLITFITMVLVFCLAVSAVFECYLSLNHKDINLGCWFGSGLFQVNWRFSFNMLALTMLVMVSFISTLVHIYSGGYMSEDPHITRFMSYLSLFTFFMFILVTGDNFVQLFLGWEGVGLCSYLLIGFWYTRVSANKAALKALIMNRIGDFGFILGVLVIYYLFRTFDIALVSSLVPYLYIETMNILGYEVYILEVGCLCLFIGSMGKSAQIGLHTWLPDAMEGPTPVSALIHAATMVTAGVFLIIKCSCIFEYASFTLFVVSVVGGATAFFAATIGFVQYDIKKVIAYSTCSQLGYMVFCCGISAYDVSFFHLVNHAFFKALLFLGAGSVIHAVAGEQDMRKFGGLLKVLPYTYSAMFIGSLALAGVPALAGFYSKDLIIETAYSSYTVGGSFCAWIGSIVALMTAAYSFRLLYLTFLMTPNAPLGYMKITHEASKSLSLAMGLLAICSIFVGYLLKDMFVGFGTQVWGNTLYVSPKNFVGVKIEEVFPLLGLIPTVLSTSGFIGAYIFYKKIYEYNCEVKSKEIFKFLSNRWYFDYVYNLFIGYSILRTSYSICYKTIDKGFLEICGPVGLSNQIYDAIRILTFKQSGMIYHYMSSIVLFSTIFFIYLYFVF